MYGVIVLFVSYEARVSHSECPITGEFYWRQYCIAEMLDRNIDATGRKLRQCSTVQYRSSTSVELMARYGKVPSLRLPSDKVQMDTRATFTQIYNKNSWKMLLALTIPLNRPLAAH